MDELPIRALVDSEFPGEWGEGSPRSGLVPCRVLRATNLGSSGIDYSTAARRYVPEAKVNVKRLRRGDVVLEAAGGGPGVPVGRVARFDPPNEEWTYVVSNFFRTLRPAKNTDSRFVCHMLHYLYRQPAIWQVQQQTTGIINLKVRDYLQLRVPVPPLEEQRRIAEILDTIDETIQATERVIAKLWQARVGAVEYELNTIDNKYRRSSLLDIVSIPSGQVDPRVEPWSSLTLVGPDHIEGDGRGRLLARVSARDQGAISGKYRFEVGDVIYSKIRPELRKAWLTTFSGLCSADMYPLSPGRTVMGEYVASVILGQRFSRFAVSVSARSSGMPKVNRRELAEFRIALAPLEVQQTVARIAESYACRIESETATLMKIKQVRSGLADDLLSGRVRTVAA
ncbi:MAG: restriction endonuclease subunit S [bacterium]|nr:restriction endonuclease subunit S [bacterium]